MPTPSSTSAKTYFGSLCFAKLEAAGMTVKDAAKKIPRTPASQFTRWRRGHWTYIPPDKIEAVAKAICPDSYRDRTDLVIAYLHDLTPMRYRPSILIGQKGENEGQGLKPMAGVGSGWSDEMRSRLDAVAEAYKVDDRFAEMVDFMVTQAKRTLRERATKE